MADDISCYVVTRGRRYAVTRAECDAATRAHGRATGSISKSLKPDRRLRSVRLRPCPLHGSIRDCVEEG